jgi:hypothetical protein
MLLSVQASLIDPSIFCHVFSSGSAAKYSRSPYERLSSTQAVVEVGTVLQQSLPGCSLQINHIVSTSK